MFWWTWPRKEGKKAAEKAWKKILPDPEKDTEMFKKIIDSLEDHKKYCKKWLDGFIPHPTTWLNQERWNDEFERVRTRPKLLVANSPVETSKSAIWTRLGFTSEKAYLEAHTTPREVFLKEVETNPHKWIKAGSRGGYLENVIGVMPLQLRTDIREAIQRGLKA